MLYYILNSYPCLCQLNNYCNIVRWFVLATVSVVLQRLGHIMLQHFAKLRRNSVGNVATFCEVVLQLATFCKVVLQRLGQCCNILQSCVAMA